jgi:hypothetical protein
LRFESPIPIGWEQQPILQIRSLQNKQITKFATLHHASCLLNQRVHADVEVDRVDKFLLGCKLDQFARLFGCHRQWFFADDMFSS